MVTTMSSIIYKYYMSILFLIWAMFPALHLHYWGLLASDVGDGNENVNSAIRCFFLFLLLLLRNDVLATDGVLRS